MKNDIISSFVYPVAAYSDDDFLYIATGFLYRKKTKFYFITSLSSILGRQVPNGEFKLKNKKIPNVLKTSFSIFEDDLIKIKKRVFPITIPVYNENFEPNFFIHPTYKKEIDIAVFPIETKGIDFVSLNDFDTVKKEKKEDIIVVGYPLVPNDKDDKNSPVFIKSKIMHNGTNIFVIDEINRIGLFGAPIFLEAQPTDNTFCFVGLYSGIEPNKKFKKPVFGWKKSFIETIIATEFKETGMD